MLWVIEFPKQSLLLWICFLVLLNTRYHHHHEQLQQPQQQGLQQLPLISESAPLFLGCIRVQLQFYCGTPPCNKQPLQSPISHSLNIFCTRDATVVRVAAFAPSAAVADALLCFVYDCAISCFGKPSDLQECSFKSVDNHVHRTTRYQPQ